MARTVGLLLLLFTQLVGCPCSGVSRILAMSRAQNKSRGNCDLGHRVDVVLR